MYKYFIFILLSYVQISYAQETDSRLCQIQSTEARPLQSSDDDTLHILKQREQQLNHTDMTLSRSPKIYCLQDVRLARSALPQWQQELHQTLGKNWTLRSSDKLLLWESKGNFWPKKYYALMYEQAPDASDTLIMRSLYAENSNSVLHSYVVFGVAVSPFILMIVIAFWLYRRIRRKKQGIKTGNY